MNVKTILKAEIRNIEIHVLAFDKGYQCVWKSQSEKTAQTLTDAELKNNIKYPFLCVINRPIVLNTALRRFRKLVEAAQDPRITFETVEHAKTL